MIAKRNARWHKMVREIINRVEVLTTGELFLGLEGPGKDNYQYVYRETGGVYWDQERRGFKSTPIKEWSCSQWFRQIVGVVRSELGVELLLSSNVSWLNIPAEQKAEIQRGEAI